MESLLGATRTDLAALCADWDEKPFRAQQMYTNMYRRGVRSFEGMSDLSLDLRQRLDLAYTLARPQVVRCQESVDGTIKWLLELHDGKHIEMVYIPEDRRGTLCVSSQIGCTLTCTFCHTGTQRLVRNLSAGEIIGQALLARDWLEDWGQVRRITNIVFMGMGEPLLNTDNVLKAIELITDGTGFGLSRRRVMLSTSGIVPEMVRAGESGVRLAISLHACRDSLRDRLVPVNRKYPLAQLLEAARRYPGLSNARRITWEYVMLAGVNDSDEDARALLGLIAGIPSKINLIPFNSWPGAGYESSPAARLESFARIVMAGGYASPVRTPRGQDILSACGQLKSGSLPVRKRRVQEGACHEA